MSIYACIVWTTLILIVGVNYIIDKLKCKHKFTSPVDEKGNQYCEKCGKVAHTHIWGLKERISKLPHYATEDSLPTRILYVYRCTGCGTEKQTTTGEA